jgi:flagellar hook-associated protein 2
MGISALGTGSSILTQDLLDQLREADEAAQVKPIEYSLTDNKDKSAEFDVIDANMTNLYDAIGELKSPALFDERTTTVTGSSVTVSADANSDLQDFTLDVTQLATKQIEESGSYDDATSTIASDDGSMTLSIGDQDFTIDYTSDTTLQDLKKSINDIAGDAVNATIVQVADGDYRLFLNSAETGADKDISFSDDSGNLSGTQLTDDLSAVQEGVDAEFTFNGESITRSSNEVDDLIKGYDITLSSLGVSEVSVTQNRDNINEKIDSFIEKYNSAMNEIASATKNSTDSSTRGIFSGESTFKAMERDLRGMMDSVGGSAGTLYDYGFDIDKDGKLSIDKSIFNDKMDENSTNVEAFFSGGEYTNDDGSVTTLDGAFMEMSDQVFEYTRYNGMLDNYKTYLDESTSSLEDSKARAIEKLDAKYETMKKQYAAYDAMIASFENASAAFTEMQNAGDNNN